MKNSVLLAQPAAGRQHTGPRHPQGEIKGDARAHRGVGARRDRRRPGGARQRDGRRYLGPLRGAREARQRADGGVHARLFGPGAENHRRRMAAVAGRAWAFASLGRLVRPAQPTDPGPRWTGPLMKRCTRCGCLRSRWRPRALPTCLGRHRPAWCWRAPAKAPPPVARYTGRGVCRAHRLLVGCEASNYFVQAHATALPDDRPEAERDEFDRRLFACATAGWATPGHRPLWCGTEGQQTGRSVVLIPGAPQMSRFAARPRRRVPATC